MVLLVVSGLGIFVGMYIFNHDPGSNSACSQPKAIDVLYPECSTLAFQQAQVGVDMAPGYTAELTLNGEPIPLDQIQNRAAANSVETRVLPDLFLFTPGPDKIVERLRPELNCAAVRYRRIGTAEDTATVFTWCFRVA